MGGDHPIALFDEGVQLAVTQAAGAKLLAFPRPPFSANVDVEGRQGNPPLAAKRLDERRVGVRFGAPKMMVDMDGGERVALLLLQGKQSVEKGDRVASARHRDAKRVAGFPKRAAAVDRKKVIGHPFPPP